MLKGYEVNQELEREFDRLRAESQTQVNVNIAAGRPKKHQFVKIDLEKLAREHRIGAYYMIQVVLECLAGLRDTEKGQSDLMAELQKQNILFHESPFTRVEQR
jgi:hypothetical protein